MSHPAILSIGTAVPDTYYDQMEICDRLAPAFNSHRAPAVFRATEIEGRYVSVADLEWLVDNPSNGERMQAYMENAVPIGIRAIEQAFEDTDLTPGDIDNFIVASCTGVDTPGLDVKIAEALGMSPYLRRATIVGMGCQALMPSLFQASNAVVAHPQAKVLVLTLELCTLHFQQGRTLKNMLGSALFADGASAAVIANGNSPGPRMLDSLTFSNYNTQKEMAFNPGDRGYQIVLTGRIPDLVGEQVPPLVNRLLKRNNLDITDVNHWIVHPGGMRILDCVEEGLRLTNDDLRHSRTILNKHGNMSSATLLFVLKRTIEKEKPAAGEYGVMLGFGPGLTIEAGLIQW